MADFWGSGLNDLQKWRVGERVLFCFLIAIVG